ncbi:MAG TPA: hypothetical protein VFE65_32160 [Pseudonocardia sp.]|nr:hypothetical protein [Pseudonocardia sp.]
MTAPRPESAIARRMDPAVLASRRYKDVTTRMTEPVARLYLADTARVAELAERLTELDEARQGTREREKQVIERTREVWEDALDELYAERWMHDRLLQPKPDPTAPARALDYLVEQLERRREALRDAVRKRGLLGPRR